MLLRMALIAAGGLLVGCTASDTLTIPTGGNWSSQVNRAPVEIVRRRQASLEETVVPAAPNAVQKSLSMNGAIGIRQWLAALGAQHQMQMRPASKGELKAGFTEAIGRDDGTAILMKENELGSQMTIRVIGPANSETKQIASAVRQQFGAMATQREDSTEQLKRDYGLPGRMEKR